MAKPVTIYKTIILYLLDKSTCPLTNQQITDFFLQENYADFFKVQEILAELTEFGMLEEFQTYESTQYSLTESGKNALDLLDDKLNVEIKDDVKAFFQQKQLSFRQDNFTYSDFKRLKKDSYQVDLKVMEDKDTIVSVSLNVRTKEQAQIICSNWKKSSDQVYDYLLDLLIQ